MKRRKYAKAVPYETWRETNPKLAKTESASFQFLDQLLLLRGEFCVSRPANGLSRSPMKAAP